MNLVFDHAVATQTQPVTNLLRAAFTPYAERAGYELRADAYDWLPQAIDDQRVYVACENERIFGVVVINPNDSINPDDSAIEIEYVATDPACQGMGIGQWLFNQLEALARRREAQALTLHTAGFRDDLIRFYLRQGFVETRRALPTHGKDQHLRVHFRKDLSLATD